MSITIITKHSSAIGAIPSSAQLVQGELAVNVTDRRIYTLDASNNVVLLSTAPITLTTTGTGGASTYIGNVLNIPQYGSGSVTTVSITSANGFAGSVANASSTPAITLSTTVTGVLKGNGTAISAAVAGTDYQIPITLTTLNTSGASTFIAGTLNIPQYQGVLTLTTTGTSGAATLIGNTLNIPQYPSGTVTTVSITSANGFSGSVATATSTPAVTLSTTVSGMVKGNLGSLVAATAGTDYQAALSLSTAGTSGAATLVSNTLTIPQYQGALSVTTTGTSGGATLSTNTLNIPQYQGAITLTNTGTSGAATLIGNTLNIPTYSTYTAASPTVIGAVYGNTGASNTGLGINVAISGSASSAVALGQLAAVSASTSGAIAIGASSSATGTQGIAIGQSAVASSTSIAIGGGATSSSSGSVAIGVSADTVSTTNSVAIGANSIASSSNSVAIGDQASVAVSSSVSIAIGFTASCTASSCIAIGQATSAGGLRAIAMGQNSSASGAYGIAIGYTANSSIQDAIVIGRQSTASISRSILLGLTVSDSLATNPVIVLSTQSTSFSAPNEGFFVSGMRATTSSTAYGFSSLQFNPTTKEISSTRDAFSAYGLNWQYQAAPVNFTAATILSAAQVGSNIITTSGSTNFALTLPLGTAMDTYFAVIAAASPALTNVSFDLALVNTGSAIITMTAAASGFSIVGNTSIQATSAGLFRIRRSGANTYVMYRIST